MIQVISAFELTVGSLEIVTSIGNANVKHSFDKGSISGSIELNDRSKFSVNLASDDNITYVGMLSEEQKSGNGIIGTHPSVHIAFRPVSEGSNTYESEVNFAEKKTTNPNGGTYSVTLLVASSDSGSKKIPLGSIKIPALHSGSSDTHIRELRAYFPDPVIVHQFKPPQERANPKFSILFAILSIMIPILGFSRGVSVLGMNMKNFTSSTRYIFFGGIASFVGLMGMFFAYLNFVQTVALAIILVVPLAVVGNKLLCQVRTAGDLSTKSE